jgi:heptosyltransferase-1
MRVLLVKMSSMGDVLHALPAVTDACDRIADVHFDWVVEEGFAEIPEWHGGVDRIIPAATRRWRKQPWSTCKERSSFREQLLEAQYDLVIDAQGLMKSAVISRWARGEVAGFDRISVREKLATLCYQYRYGVDRNLHAVERQRRLFALALNYDYLPGPPNYGIDTGRLPRSEVLPDQPYIVLLHGTTWHSKRWPVANWESICQLAGDAGYRVVVPWADDREREVASQITSGLHGTMVSRRLELGELARMLADAAGVVAVDTGPGHLAAALAVPCVSVYGATDPGLTGTQGINQAHLCAKYECVPCLSRKCRKLGDTSGDPPCYETLSVGGVWGALEILMEAGRQDMRDI